MKLLKFEVTLPILLDYLSWRKSQLNAEGILKLYGLLTQVSPEDVSVVLLKNCSFMELNMLRQQFNKLTTYDLTVIWGLVTVQNNLRSPAQQEFNASENLSVTHPDLFNSARPRKTVAPARVVFTEAVKKAADQKERRSKRKLVSGEQVSLFLP